MDGAGVAPTFGPDGLTSEDSLGHDQTQTHAHAHASALASSRRYALGVLLLLAVVVLWVGSSALIQSIFVNENFHRPFMLTYYSTSLFTIYLPIWALRQWVAGRGWGSGGRERARMRRAAVLLNDTGASPSGSAIHAPSPHDDAIEANGASSSLHGSSVPGAVSKEPPRSPVLFDTHQLGRGCSSEPLAVSPRLIDVEAADGARGSPTTSASVAAAAGSTLVDGHHWNLWSTARLSLVLCPIWLCMNLTFNLALGLTSIASSTILATTSSLWVLVFTRVLVPGETVRAQQVVGVLATILGAVLISWKDTGHAGGGGDTPSAGTGGGAFVDPDVSELDLPHRLAGDVLAALSAIFYGLFSVQLRLRIPDERLVDMQLVFGLLGLCNLTLSWPLFFLFHASGVEEWRGVPAPRVLAFLTLNGLFGTVVSDYLWAKSVLLTSPLIASLGLALTVPLALLLDWAVHDAQFTPFYLLGGLCVLAGFALVNLAHSKQLEQQAVEAEERAEQQQQEGEEEEAEGRLSLPLPLHSPPQLHLPSSSSSSSRTSNASLGPTAPLIMTRGDRTHADSTTTDADGAHVSRRSGESSRTDGFQLELMPSPPSQSPGSDSVDHDEDEPAGSTTTTNDW